MEDHTSDRLGISSFALKVAAIVGMTCNHVANVFAADLPGGLMLGLYSLGGLTFPIMAFLLVEGYRHTSNLRKYAQRLAGFALVAQVPYSLLWGAVPNVLWTLLLALGVLWAYDNLQQKAVFWLGLVLAYFASAGFDWGGVGIAMPLLFYFLRDRRFGTAVVMLVPLFASLAPAAEDLVALHAAGYDNLQALAAMLDFKSETQAPLIPCSNGENKILEAGVYPTLYGAIGYSTIGFGLATVLLCLYDGSRGRPMKWFFYCYYPAHLALIWAASLLMS